MPVDKKIGRGIVQYSSLYPPIYAMVLCIGDTITH